MFDFKCFCLVLFLLKKGIIIFLYFWSLFNPPCLFFSFWINVLTRNSILGKILAPIGLVLLQFYSSSTPVLLQFSQYKYLSFNTPLSSVTEPKTNNNVNLKLADILFNKLDIQDEILSRDKSIYKFGLSVCLFVCLSVCIQ